MSLEHAPQRDKRRRRGADRRPLGDISLFNGELVNRSELARLLQVPVAKIAAWCALPNGLPRIRLPSGDPERKGNRLLFNVSEVRAWIESHREGTNPTPDTQSKRRKKA
jgi:hypothetical protein